MVLFIIDAILEIIVIKLIGTWAFEQNKAYYYDDLDDYNNTYYILLIGGIILVLPFLITAKYTLLAKVLQDTNTSIHHKMLQNVTRSIISFFDITPIGTILNRFSNDLGGFDSSSLSLFRDVIEGHLQVISMMLTLAIIHPYIAIPSAIVLILLYKYRNFYSKPVVETKRLDLAARSPIYSDISSTIGGLVIIRAFR